MANAADGKSRVEFTKLFDSRIRVIWFLSVHNLPLFVVEQIQPSWVTVCGILSRPQIGWCKEGAQGAFFSAPYAQY